MPRAAAEAAGAGAGGTAEQAGGGGEGRGEAGREPLEAPGEAPQHGPQRTAAGLQGGLLEVLPERLALLRQQPPGGLQVWPFQDLLRGGRGGLAGLQAGQHGGLPANGLGQLAERLGAAPGVLGVGPDGLEAGRVQALGQPAGGAAGGLVGPAGAALPDQPVAQGAAAGLVGGAAPGGPAGEDLEAPRRLLAQPREAVGQHLQGVSLEACRRALRGLARRLQRLPASPAATLAAAGLLGAAPAWSCTWPPSPPPAATRPSGPAPSA